MRRKLNPLRDAIAGKRLVVVDDSIVRGTTTKGMLAMLREVGAKEVHLRISSPPYRWPCFYGLDTGTRSELIAADLEVGEICDYLGADSLAYLSLDALKKATGVPGAGFCDACLTGDYPVPVPGQALSKTVSSVPRMRRCPQGAFVAPLPRRRQHSRRQPIAVPETGMAGMRPSPTPPPAWTSTPASEAVSLMQPLVASTAPARR